MNKKITGIILLILVSAICFVGCGEQKPETVYEYGTFVSEIGDVFDIKSGTKSDTAIMSKETNFSPVAISSAQTKDGGWVAWDDGKYVYTAEDVGEQSVCYEFINYYY